MRTLASSVTRQEALAGPSKLAKDLMKSLEETVPEGSEVVVSDKLLDGQEDVDNDEPHMPIPGWTIMDAGKYKKKKDVTFGEMYKMDKEYLVWCRAHLGVNSVSTMRRFWLYVELRDQRKRSRIEKTSSGQHGQGEELQQEGEDGCGEHGRGEV